MTPENKIKAEIKKYLKMVPEVDVFHFSVPASGMSKAGIADIICCYKGRFLAIEVKSEAAYAKSYHNMSEAQQAFRDSVIKAGGWFICASGFGHVLATLLKMDQYLNSA